MATMTRSAGRHEGGHRAADGRPPIELILVVGDGCHLCDHGREVLASLGDELPLRVREVMLDSPEGRDLAERVPLVFPPILIRAGTVLSYGRLSERRLRKELADGR